MSFYFFAFRMKYLLSITLSVILLLTACINSNSGGKTDIIIFHAGSLSVPLRQLKIEYEKVNPGINILLEPAGSLVCARKITELKKPCDIIASADYFVIDELLIPEYAKWSIRFATNEIVVACHDKSAYFKDITSDNWMDILLKEDVIYARSDPHSDPGGYRTVLSLMLAEKYYNRAGLTEQMLNKNTDYIRPKEVDLIALLETNAIDYMFQYKSVAVQHGMKYVELPDEINLSDPDYEDNYRTVSVDVTGSKPGSHIKVTGGYINYSMTVPDSAPHSEEAIDFVYYMLSETGMEIFRQNGQDPIVPFSTEQPDKIPEQLMKYLSESSGN
jgi:molybdate/tungstate transport system substrate-binding protein